MIDTTWKLQGMLDSLRLLSGGATDGKVAVFVKPDIADMFGVYNPRSNTWGITEQGEELLRVLHAESCRMLTEEKDA